MSWGGRDEHPRPLRWLRVVPVDAANPVALSLASREAVLVLWKAPTSTRVGILLVPRYDLQCPVCDATWEVQRSMNADNPPCPKCGHAPVTQLPARTSFTLRGGGWAADHYSKGTTR